MWLAKRGHAAAVVGLDAAARRMAVSVAFGSVPVLEVDLTGPTPLALTCLARAAGGAEGGPLGAAAHLAEALSGEGVGEHFFAAFRDTLESMTASLTSPPGASDRRTLALLQLTRVLFLYFVQSKGWLDAREDFLRREVDRCLARGRHIHRDLLRPLFFGTLNRPVEARGGAARAFGNIPFLNGGLFEPHQLERHHPSDVPTSVWRDAFDGLFERFHFTASEPGAEGSIAPDMLGRVFEGVMAPDVRRASGTFYTPAFLVRRLVDAGLIALVASRMRCSDADAESRIAQGGPALQSILEEVALLDPAVGSGAFLLGALERLTALRLPCGLSSTTLKREILRRNLFGVDINPAAVRLAELRLWLAVIADDPADRPEHVAPLPNLDCLIRQGDSLADPVSLLVGLPLRAAAAGPLLAHVRRRFVTATGLNKVEAARALRRIESQAVNECLGFGERRLQIEIAECIADARSPTLFGDLRGLDPALRSRLIRLRGRLRALRVLRRRVERDGEIPWFQYESHFADVFAHGGFDLVIGNPPWIRAEHLTTVVRERLRRRYRWWKCKTGRGYGHQPDMSVAFAERARELTAPGGAIALLLPAKVATAAYGTAMRQSLTAEDTLHAVADLTDDVGRRFEATVYPLALIATKRRPRPAHLVRSRLDISGGQSVPQESLAGGAPWMLVDSTVRDALAEVMGDHPRLGERLSPQLGVKTGANAVFLNPQAEIEPELLRWAIRGRDLRAFQATPRTRLVWTHDEDGRVLAKLPPRARMYFKAHLPILTARADYSGGPPWMLFRTVPAAAAQRVVWSDLARRLTALALVDGGDRALIPLNTCYVVSMRSARSAKCVAAWLNCSFLSAAARLHADPASGGFARFNARTVAGLPLPDAVLEDADLATIASAGRMGAPFQDQLDEICTAHLRLSSAARRALARFATGHSDRRR